MWGFCLMTPKQIALAFATFEDVEFITGVTLKDLTPDAVRDGFELYLANQEDLSTVADALRTGIDYMAVDKERLQELSKATDCPALESDTRQEILNDIDDLRRPKKSLQKAKSHALGAIYLGTSERHPFTKIGFSKTPAMRENTLQGDDPGFKMIFQSDIKFTQPFEQQLHQKFAAKRRRGEWFCLDNEDIENIKNACL